MIKYGVTLELLSILFERFDRGEEVSQAVPLNWELKEGERIRMQCGDHVGIARVIKIGEQHRASVICTFKKDS